MQDLLFGCLPVFPLPEAFAHAYPDMVTIHMIMSFFGVVIFAAGVCFLAMFLFFYITRLLKQESKKIRKDIMWTFLWAFGFGIFGLYVFIFLLVFIGVMGYRQYS